MQWSGRAASLQEGKDGTRRRGAQLGVNPDAELDPPPDEVARAAGGQAEVVLAQVIVVVASAGAEASRPATPACRGAWPGLRGEARRHLRVLHPVGEVADPKRLVAREAVAKKEAAFR